MLFSLFVYLVEHKLAGSFLPFTKTDKQNYYEFTHNCSLLIEINSCVIERFKNFSSLKKIWTNNPFVGFELEKN